MTAQQLDIFDAIDAQREHEARAMAAATDWRRAADWALFLDTLYADHLAHGYISQNRVRVALSNEHGLVINPRAYSGMWPRARKGKRSGIDAHGPLIELHGVERCTTSRSGNNHKDLPTYRWIGPPRLSP